MLMTDQSNQHIIYWNRTHNQPYLLRKLGWTVESLSEEKEKSCRSYNI